MLEKVPAGVAPHSALGNLAPETFALVATAGVQKWLRKSEQGDKWNRCLIEGMIVLSETGARDEQTTPP